MKRSLLAAALGASLLGSILPAYPAEEVEVLHWWTSGGEANSVAELKKMLEAKGYKWKDFAVAGGGGENAMTVLKSRVVSGNPPTAAQIKGPTIQEWGAEGVLANLDEYRQGRHLGQPAAARGRATVMKYKGHYVAAPVNVHRVNWMWANPEVFKQAGAKVPDHLGRVRRRVRQDPEGRHDRRGARRPALAGCDRVRIGRAGCGRRRLLQQGLRASSTRPRSAVRPWKRPSRYLRKSRSARTRVRRA